MTAAEEMEKIGIYICAWQRVAVCCSVLQSFTHMLAAKEMEKMGIYIYVWQRVAVCCSALQYVTMFYTYGCRERDGENGYVRLCLAQKRTHMACAKVIEKI